VTDSGFGAAHAAAILVILTVMLDHEKTTWMLLVALLEIVGFLVC